MTFTCSEDSSSSEPKSEVPEARDLFMTYLHEVSKYPLITRAEERKMAQRVRMEGDGNAGRRMVLANLRLVVRMARDYRSHPNFLDFIQEGNLGLMCAVGEYDPAKGTRFSTYAAFWVRAYMLKYLMDSWSMVKVGTKDSQRRLFYSLKREKEKLEKSGIIPSVEILSDKLKVSSADIEDMEQRLYHGDVSLEAAQHGYGEALIDTIGSGEDIEETLIEKDYMEMLHKKINEFKKQLNEKKRFILEHRIIAENPVTLREIGERFNTSREGVRQMEMKVSKDLIRYLRGSSELRPST